MVGGKGDDCAVLNRGKLSVFFWDDDKKSKRIDHPLSSSISMINVNEPKDNFDSYPHMSINS